MYSSCPAVVQVVKPTLFAALGIDFTFRFVLHLAIQAVTVFLSR